MARPRDDKRAEILAFLERYISAPGYSPTYDEIAAGVGLQSKSHVGYYLDSLVDEGKISRRVGSPRALGVISHGLRGLKVG